MEVLPNTFFPNTVETSAHISWSSSLDHENDSFVSTLPQLLIFKVTGIIASKFGHLAAVASLEV